MAKNLGREYAAMTEDERREFELKRGGTAGDPERDDDAPAEELDLGDPRRYPRLKDDVVPPGAEDGRDG
jgi:hypothetical protein